MNRVTTPSSDQPKVLAFSTLGEGSNDEMRIRDLLADLNPIVHPFQRDRKIRSFWSLLQRIRTERPDLAVMEGTGVAGGMALMIARLLFGVRYVFSSGDAVGPWVGHHMPMLGPLFALYERILCLFSSGFIGWTPYLAGRALTFGTPRAMTAAGWAPFRRPLEQQLSDRERLRQTLGIPADHIVIGIVGSLIWNRRFSYCYGLELIEAARKVQRSDVTFLVVGDGPGRAKLESLAALLPSGRVLFTGRIPQDQLPGYFAVCDIGSLPQSVDRVGSFRYTTKLSEYLAFGLPILTGQIPLAYDLDEGWLWRLPGSAPWKPEYTDAMAALIDRLSTDEVLQKRKAVPRDHPIFDRSTQARRVAAFVRDIIGVRGV